MANKQLYTNNATTTINGGITNVATSIALSPGTGALFPSPTSGDWFIGTLYDGVSVIEVVKVTARSSDTLTVVRGQEGTSGSAFLTGASFMENVTKGTLEQFIQRTGDAIEDTPIGAVTPSTGAFTGVTGTSFNKLTIVAPATTASLAITDTKSVAFLKSLTFTGTDGITITFPATNATMARTDAANTFTGTQTFGALVATTLNGNTLTSGSSTFTGTAGQTYTFPTTSAALARTDAAQTFTGLQTFSTGITSTAASNSFGATVFSGAITGGQAATLGATSATTLSTSTSTSSPFYTASNAGAAATPIYRFSNESNTGLYGTGSAGVSISLAGTHAATFIATGGLFGANSRTFIRQSASGDTELGGSAGSAFTDIFVNNAAVARFVSGLVIGSPTGGDKGAGSINAVTIWKNGTALDIVFEPDYQMATIDEMTAYYTENKHLPTIPTKEVFQEGSTDMGGLTDRLWETVEVQARYISELNDRLKALEGVQV